MNKRFSPTLRVRITLGVALPILLGFGGLSLLQYMREESLIRQEMENWAVNVGEIMISTLQHAMVTHDRDEVNEIIQDTTSSGGIVGVKLIDKHYVLRAGNGEPRGAILSLASVGCIECHKYPPAERPRALTVASEPNGVLRVANPINNQPECAECHDQKDKHIGVLLIDVSEVKQHQAAQNAAILNLSLSVIVTLLVSLWIYFNLDKLIAARLHAFNTPLDDYANGDFAVRLPLSRNHDEIDGLAEAFNQMAGKLEYHIEESKRQGELVQRRIIEERERIARELHDSLPQLLAYLTTKIGAIRLFLEHDKKSEALENLEQLDAASRKLFNDVREAIIGLRMSRRVSEGLVPAVKEYIDGFTQLSGLPVNFRTNVGTREDGRDMDPEMQIQVLRIVQEALSNVRKHAQASQASVELQLADSTLKLVIKDNGKGFDVKANKASGIARFGLQTMRERAEAVGGEFQLVSEPGKGTTITVALPTHRAEGE